MKKLIIFAAVLLLGGCVADKKPDPPSRRDGPPPLIAPDQQLMDAYYAALKGQQPIFLAALEANNTSAPAVVLAATPAAPAGARPALSNLRSFVIGNGCPASAEQRISPSVPATAAWQRAEGEDVADRQAGEEAAVNDRGRGGVVTKQKESVAAAPPPANVRLLSPAK